MTWDELFKEFKRLEEEAKALPKNNESLALVATLKIAISVADLTRRVEALEAKSLGDK